jgi:hypothetical protein
VPDAKASKTSDRKLSGAAARAVEKKLKEGARPMAQGVGESKRFGGDGPEKDLTGYTCNGLPIPKELWQSFPYSLTDQAKEEMAGINKGLARDLPHVYAGRDRSEYERVFDPDKKVRKFADDRRAPDTEGLVIVRDPLQPLIERHTPAGHRGMFLSTKKCQQEGLIRGGVEYTRVMMDDPENPGTKIPVTCGGMFLASAPIDTVERADRYWRSLGQDQQRQAIEKVQQKAEEVMSTREMGDFARRRGIGDTLVGMEVEDQERGDAEMLREALAHE